MKAKRLGRGLSSLVGPAVRVAVGEGDEGSRLNDRSSKTEGQEGGGASGSLERTSGSSDVRLRNTDEGDRGPDARGRGSEFGAGGSISSDGRSGAGDDLSDNSGVRGGDNGAGEWRASDGVRGESGGGTGSRGGELAGREAGQDEASGVVMVGVEEVDRSPYQPRRAMDPEALERLSESIRRSGLMQPIVVRVRGGRYELIAGERRLLAAKRAGLSRVPAMVREVDDLEAAQLALVENLQREDLNPLERSGGFRMLMKQFGLSQTDVADVVGVDRSTVGNLIRLAELEPEIQGMVGRGELGLGHAKVLLGMMPGEYRVRVARAAARRGWSVRKLEQMPGRLDGHGRVILRASKPAEILDLEEKLSAHLGTRVSVMVGKTKKKGRLVIEFYGIDHFEGLVGRMGFKGGL